MLCHKKLQMQKPDCNQYWTESSTDPVDNKMAKLLIITWQTNTKKGQNILICFLSSPNGFHACRFLHVTKLHYPIVQNKNHRLKRFYFIIIGENENIWSLH